MSQPERYRGRVETRAAHTYLLKLELTHSGLYGGSVHGCIGVCLVLLPLQDAYEEHRANALVADSAPRHFPVAAFGLRLNEGDRSTFSSIAGAGLRCQLDLARSSLSGHNRPGTPPRHD